MESLDLTGEAMMDYCSFEWAKDWDKQKYISEQKTIARDLWKDLMAIVDQLPEEDQEAYKFRLVKATDLFKSRINKSNQLITQKYQAPPQEPAIPTTSWEYMDYLLNN